MRVSSIFFYPAILVLFLSGCQPGSGEGLDQNGDPVTSGSGSSIPLADNLRSIQANIFTPDCATSGCHSGASPAQGMLLTEGSSFDNLVGVDSNENLALKRVSPRNPDDSYLIRKVEGTQSVGARMPLNAPALSTEEIDALRGWVQKGAFLFDPTLAAIQVNVLTPMCVQCHFGPNPAGQLNLEQGQAFDDLVGVQRAFDPEIRVVAGNADSSFLVDKLEGNNLGNSRGARMPLGGPFLDQDTIDVIREWINNGASNN